MEELVREVRELYYTFQEEYSRSRECLPEERRKYYLKEFNVYLPIMHGLHRRKLVRAIACLEQSPK
jgi:hypothetical protein